MRRAVILLAGVIAGVLPLGARQAPPLEAVVDATRFRNIGPFRTSAWITEIAVPEAPAREHLYTIYAATRSGGLWKTSNNGITWTPISDSVEAAAVGAVAVAPSDSNIVWMGTGDQANARSSYSGKGVFKSTDAGATWQFAGLPDSHHIARIVIHPRNPEIVYVAAMGHLFSRNEERGVFRTKDGGRTWEKVLYVDDGTGAIDLVINRESPDTLYAAMYEKHRTPWHLILGGPGTALYRTDDGGTTWSKVPGLPSGNVGRIGIDISRRDPRVLTVIVENLNPRSAGMPARRDACAPAGRGAQPQPGGPVGNEVYRSTDGGRTWTKTHGDEIDVAGSKAPYSFNQIRSNPADPDHLLVTSDYMYESRDGGRTWTCNFMRSVFGDHRTIWWDPDDPQRIMLGSDGGVNVSYDGGRTATYFPNKRIGEVYAIGVDMEDPYNVYAGLQDHDSWKGPSNARSGAITLEDWTTVGTQDGMYNQVDPTDSRWVYNSFQLGGQRRLDQQTGTVTVIEPRREAGEPPLRYNWITPLVLSPHDPKTLYTGAQVLFRSRNQGDDWQEISGDLTTNDPARCGVSNIGNVPYCTITTISESPVAPGVIWVGTDDGRVHLTRDHGRAWTEMTGAIAAAGGPADRYVSRVFASPHDAGTAFVAKNGFRNDDFRPFLYRTTDFGRTWQPIAANLPQAPINVVVQDRKSRDLLIVGNDLGVWVSLDGGAAWIRLKGNLPTVAVHDLTVHPRENDLVLGTYGRGLFIGDITHLQELSPAVVARRLHVFAVEPRAAYQFRALGNYHLYGDAFIRVPNEPDALVVNYFVRETTAAGAQVRVLDAAGREIAEMRGPAEAGLNRVLWNMRASGGGQGRGGGPLMPVGEYRIVVRVGDDEQTVAAQIRDRAR
ncbi:MAG TPA: hypothetical protein VM364_07290 [Vicinamibacterales bacterium]|nr:hypothetical protein [Vicinamibacterales bacterium]